MTRNDRLGRGLGALLGDYMDTTQLPEAREESPARLPVRLIAPNPYQPRRAFPPDELTELAASIRANGLIQPILVRKAAKGYEMVAGERRLRAVKQLGWSEIPAQVRDADDRTLLVLALVENLQREELGPLEEADGYHRLRKVFGHTQQEIADAVGKSRSAVANMLRLRGLPPAVRRMLAEGTLSKGHGRALLGIAEARQAADLARRAVVAGWSVRETEQQVRQAIEQARQEKTKEAEEAKDRPEDAGTVDPAIDFLRNALAEHLGTRVTIGWKGEGKGAIRIPFDGARQLEQLFAAITGKDTGGFLD